MRKLYVFTLVSIAVLAAVMGNAFYNHRQFYPSMVALSQSRLFNVLVSNTFMVVVLLGFHLIRFVFFGKLRDQEVEKVMESTAFFLMETFLTLTVFGERFTVKMVALFILCVFWKIFHWLAQSRLDFIEQTPGIGSGQLRLAIFLFILIFVDSAVGRVLIDDMMTNGPSVKLLLLENFVVMAVLATAALLRLVLHLVDAKQNRRWEAKGAARFYLEIVSDVMQCIICITFFFIITAYYGPAINLLREMFVSVRNLHRTIKNFLNYRRLAANLDTKFADATEAEIQEDPQCSICFDELQLGDAKKLPCGHMFHKHCLRQWLERQTTCPYCRTNIDTSVDTRRDAAADAAARRAAEPAAEAAAPAGAAAAPAAEAAAVPAPTAAAGTTAAPADAGTAAPAANARMSDADVQSAYKLYCAMFEQQPKHDQPAAAAAAPVVSSSSSSTPAAAAPAPPAPAAAPAPPAAPVAAAAAAAPALSIPVLTTPMPSTGPSLGQMSLDEIEIYRDFHKDMHEAYTMLHKRMAGVKRGEAGSPAGSLRL